MRIHRFSVLIVPVLALTLLGPTVAPRSAQAQAAAVKVAVAPLPQIHGGIVALDGDTLTISTMEGDKKTLKKLTLAKDVALHLVPDKKPDESPAGQRTDLTPGASVTVTLTADGATVESILIQGRMVQGTIVAVDATSITLSSKDYAGVHEDKFAFVPEVQVILGHGPKKDSTQTGAIADLKPGMRISATLSAIKKDTIRSLAVDPHPASNTKAPPTN